MLWHDLLIAVVLASDTHACMLQGRKVAEVAGAAQRVGRLADQAGGGSMITTKSLASYDDDGEEEVLHRLNLILKVHLSMSRQTTSMLASARDRDSRTDGMASALQLVHKTQAFNCFTYARHSAHFSDSKVWPC